MCELGYCRAQDFLKIKTSNGNTRNWTTNLLHSMQIPDPLSHKNEDILNKY